MYIRHLFLLNSSLHKQPFITAHFCITAHLLHHCTLKQALHEVTRATTVASLLYVSPSWWDFILAREYLPLITVQALREVSVFDHAVLLLHCWTNSHYPMPGLNVVIKPYKLVLLPTAYMDKAFLVIGMQFSIGKMIKKKTKFDCPVPN